ncbi:MAG: hypothetical protein J5836_00585 [Clostridia bacterium]|nr:hypothetical protein [Clostridia bacterium]MBR4762347.1 hypothetical protein [Clostridia bacterium]
MDRKIIGNGRVFSDEITISYTLRSDDITKGTKPQGTPYVSRKAYFDKKGYNAETKSRIICKRAKSGIKITLTTDSDDLSEFGLNLPFNFMGKKNGGGWRKQYLFNSPYSSSDNENVYCYFTNPDGNNLMLVFGGKADGWKMDYSFFLGGHYFWNLKALANFDRAYKTGSENKELVLYLFEVGSFEEGLEKVSEVKGLPVAVYDKSGGAVGEKIKIKAIGKCDGYEINGENFPYSENFVYEINTTGITEIIPVYKGKKGLGCSVYGYESVGDLYASSMRAVSMEDIAKTDGNLCENQCWVSAMLRFMLIFGKNERYEDLVKAELDVICETDEGKAVARQTILDKPHGRFPAFNVYKSGRVQEQFFGITILLDAYKYFKDEKYLFYATNALDCIIQNYQKADGRIETYTDWSNSYDDYTTVCAPIIPVIDMALFFADKNVKKSSYYKDGARKIAEYLYRRGLSFPTEGGVTDRAETEMEDGSISCTALSLLYYCAKIERREEFIKKAKEILDMHESWEIKTPLAPMFRSSLRWWETKWEGDEDGNALCCGHAWTIWRAEADYWYYYLTGDEEYRLKAYNGFMSNFAKIDGKGKSYSCYQCDYITGGGFADRAEDVEFRIAKGFPRRTDSGLSRYVWIRLAEILYGDKM